MLCYITVVLTTFVHASSLVYGVRGRGQGDARARGEAARSAPRLLQGLGHRNCQGPL